jgi:hypothetical protein
MNGVRGKGGYMVSPLIYIPTRNLMETGRRILETGSRSGEKVLRGFLLSVQYSRELNCTRKI